MPSCAALIGFYQSVIVLFYSVFLSDTEYKECFKNDV